MDNGQQSRGGVLSERGEDQVCPAEFPLAHCSAEIANRAREAPASDEQKSSRTSLAKTLAIRLPDALEVPHMVR